MSNHTNIFNLPESTEDDSILFENLMDDSVVPTDPETLITPNPPTSGERYQTNQPMFMQGMRALRQIMPLLPMSLISLMLSLLPISLMSLMLLFTFEMGNVTILLCRTIGGPWPWLSPLLGVAILCVAIRVVLVPLTWGFRSGKSFTKIPESWYSLIKLKVFCGGTMCLLYGLNFLIAKPIILVIMLFMGLTWILTRDGRAGPYQAVAWIGMMLGLSAPILLSHLLLACLIHWTPPVAVLVASSACVAGVVRDVPQKDWSLCFLVGLGGVGVYFLTCTLLSLI